jgi:leukotriene-A4 hydrolase
VPQVDRVVSSVGRMKYLKPLYKVLLETAHGETARKLFEKNKDSYHPIARQVLEGMLKKSGV